MLLSYLSCFTWKLIFHKQPSWPIYAEHLDKTCMGNFVGKFSVAYLNVLLCFRSKISFRTAAGWTVVLTFYLDLVLPFCFLKWNWFFLTFIPALCKSRHYFHYWLPWEMGTNLQVQRFPLIKFWYTIWMYGGSDFQSKNIQKRLFHKYLFFLKLLE